MIDFHVIASLLAVLLTVPALWGTMFLLNSKRDIRCIFAFFMALSLWGVLRIAFWDIGPAIVDMETWDEFSNRFNGIMFNTLMNLIMACVALVQILHMRRLRARR